MTDDASRWEKFAQSEPYFAVLAHERFLRGKMTPESETEFFATGDAWAELVFATLRRLAPAMKPDSVLEFGCGPGRLALAFGRRVARVVAVDASPEMRRLTKEAASRFNVATVVTSTIEELLATGEQFDLVSAQRVLQHLHPSRGIPILARLLERVVDGGFASVHVPYHSTSSTAKRALRRVRSSFGPINRAANALRGRSADIPLLIANVYDLSEVAEVFSSASCELPHVEFAREGDLDVAQFFAQKKPRPAVEDEHRGHAPAEPALDFIDVRALIATTRIEDLIRTADHYFSSLPDREHHLAKPFASIEDASQILTHVGPLLAGLRLAPGDSVLEFGAGTGWLSHALTQLGCRMIVLDVSSAALDIARELYRRHPIIGDRPEPQFLVFDGRQIDLNDATVDRIICFDAFHHAPNPDDVIAELARVLRPGGIAGFSEPGPNHSKTPQSQFEMRMYRVVENDVDIRAIWRTARHNGFLNIELAAISGPPLLLSLAEYEDLLGGGQMTMRWVETTQAFLSNIRMFFLTREGQERAESRRREGLAASITARIHPGASVGEPIEIDATIVNSGTSTWLPSSRGIGGVSLGAHLYAQNGALLDFEFLRAPFALEIAPGESVSVGMKTKPLPAGARSLELDCVADGVTWFAQVGSPTLRIDLSVS